jgi:hypothetical protein
MAHLAAREQLGLVVWLNPTQMSVDPKIPVINNTPVCIPGELKLGIYKQIKGVSAIAVHVAGRVRLRRFGFSLTDQSETICSLSEVISKPENLYTD